MISTPARIVRLLGRASTTAPVDAVFVARVRERIEPPLATAGFDFVTAEAAADARRRSTVVRYRADPGTFIQRFPGARGLLRAEGAPLEFWIARDADAGTVTSELESFEPAALLAAVRAGPGAPPRRRHVEGVPTASFEEAVDRDAELLTRFLAVVAAG